MQTITTDELAGYRLDRKARAKLDGGLVTKALGAGLLLAFAATVLGLFDNLNAKLLWPGCVGLVVLGTAGVIHLRLRTLACTTCHQRMTKGLMAPPKLHFAHFSGGSDWIAGTDRGVAATYTQMWEQDHEGRPRRLCTAQIWCEYFTCEGCQHYVPSSVTIMKRIGDENAIRGRVGDHPRIKARKRRRSAQNRRDA